MKNYQFINLLSFVDALNSLSPKFFQTYLDYNHIELKRNEIDDFKEFINVLLDPIGDNMDIADSYFLGYTIPQISKEFDLLRIGKTQIINIEIKKSSDRDKILKQLIKNKYYLNFLGKKVFNFTYVVSTNKLFYLHKDSTLKEVTITQLVNLLKGQDIEFIDDINRLFTPSNYLVSPFNSTEAFIEGNYFLTNQQEKFKKEILDQIANRTFNFFSITGNAGTGKTLLTYDIAKELINLNYKIKVYHCGKLNQGHNKLRSHYNWPIQSVKYLNFSDFPDIIILDEAQRNQIDQLNLIIDYAINNSKICIFSYDEKQCLANHEFNRDAPKKIRERCNPNFFNLSDKIRTNPEISNFILRLLNLKRNNVTTTESNIQIRYFKDTVNAKLYIESLKDTEWEIINYTESRFDKYHYDNYTVLNEKTVHDVLGQEFENVVAIIDKTFYYNERGFLDTTQANAYYNPRHMLFQILTRTKTKLMVIVIDNPKVLSRCYEITKIITL